MGRKSEGKGQARPKPADLALIIEGCEAKSLRAVCRDLGFHAPSTLAMIDESPDLCEQYTRACEMRAFGLQDEALTVTKAAALGKTVDGKKVEAAGARAYFDAIRWANAQMAPKRFREGAKIEHEGTVGLTVVVRRFSDEPEQAD